MTFIKQPLKVQLQLDAIFGNFFCSIINSYNFEGLSLNFFNVILITLISCKLCSINMTHMSEQTNLTNKEYECFCYMQ